MLASGIAGDQDVEVDFSGLLGIDMNNQVAFEEGMYSRQTLFNKAKRVVVKVGSAILTAKDGLNHEVIGNLAREGCIGAVGADVIGRSSRNRRRVRGAAAEDSVRTAGQSTEEVGQAGTIQVAQRIEARTQVK